MAINRSSMKKEMQGGMKMMESPKEDAADRRAGIAENSRRDTDMKQERGRRTGGEGGGVGVVRPGPVANKTPGAMKMSPHKKLAAGAKGVVKGK